MRSSDLVHFFEDGMKLKISSEITPPLTVHRRWKLEKKNVKGVLRGHNRGMTFILRTDNGIFLKINIKTVNPLQKD